MMSIFPQLLSQPMIVAKEASIESKGNAQIACAIKSAAKHNLAQEIDKALKENENTDKVTISQKELATMINAAVNNKRKRDSRKKSSEDATTSTPLSSTGGEKTSNKRVKFAKNTNTQKQKPNTLKKNNRYQKDANQQNPNTRHNFHPGGRKQHQQKRRHNNQQDRNDGGRGRGNGRGGRGARGRGRGQGRA